MQTEDIKREFLNIVFAQQKLIINIAAVIFILSILIAFFWPSTFSATASILLREKSVEKNQAAIEEVREQIDRFELSKEDLSSEIETLTSFEVVERTYKYLDANGFYGDKKNGVLRTIKKVLLFWKKDNPLADAYDEIYSIKSKLRTTIVPASNVIEIALLDRDSDRAVTILNALLDQYIVYRADVYSPVKLKFFADNTETFRKEMEKKIGDLTSLVEKNRISDPEKEMANNLVLKINLEQQLNLLMNEKTDKELIAGNLSMLLNKKSIQTFSSQGNSSLAALGQKLQELYIEKDTVLRKYHPKSVNVVLIEKQIDSTYDKLKREVGIQQELMQKELESVQSKISRIENQIESINTRNVALHKQLVDMDRVQRELNLNQDSYETFFKRTEEIKVSNNSNSILSPVSIISRAFPSDGPVFPKKKLVIGIGLLIGLLIGLSLGIIREYFDHTFKHPDDVIQITNLPVIFSIKRWE
jgi:uncharacterized protein involved in exopolysaccharide biosynthesis